MKHTLSFGYLYTITPNIAELVIDELVTVTPDMHTEYAEFIEKKFAKPYALLINNINPYQCVEETHRLIGNNSNLAATAVVSYSKNDMSVVDDFFELRKADEINFQLYSGFDMGRAKALRWLERELTISIADA